MRPMVRWIALFGLIAACGDLEYGTAESEVIGGKVTLPGEFPGVGALMYDFGNGPEAGCTGTLIAPDAVLTAAHCVDPELVGNTINGFTLALDTHAGAPAITPVKTTFKHDLFTLDGVSGEGLGEAHDVGIVLLMAPITEVAPVKMPRPVDSPQILADMDLQIVGYGKTTVDGNDVGVMFDAQTKLVSLDATEIQVGAGSPQPQNCNGDSGGPGFATVGGQRRVIGIVSRSFSGFECTMGGIDTRVDAYLDFIHSKVTTGIPCDSGLAEACPPEPGGGDDGGGCCSVAGDGSRGAPGAAILGLFLGFVLLRRRRA